MRVWITRTAPEAQATAERVAALGHRAIIAPLLAVERLAGVPPLDGVGALAFSSRHAVEAFARSSTARALPVFVTGAATARAARAAGFTQVRDADGDGRALARVIAAEHRGSNGAVLHPAAEEPAFDMVAALAAEAVQASSYAAYRTFPLELTPNVVALLRDAALDAVLVHSAKAAGEIARRLTSGQAGRLHAYVISASVAEALAGAGFKGVHVADQPTEAALLRRLGPASDEAHA